jgi:hypothetical protein
MRRLILAALVGLAAAPAAAQPVDEPLPRLVTDLQGLWGGLPSSEGWTPEVPALTPIPDRGFGVGLGAHVYPMRLGIITFGIGATVLVARGKGDPSSVIFTPTGGGSAVTGEATLPVVTTTMMSLVPQISMNFGRRFGWSYLSAGYGTTRIASTAAAIGMLPAVSAPDQWNPALNFGGGARWFMKRHIGASFDLRFTKLSSRAATDTSPFAKRTQIVNLLVGISLQ